MKSKFSLKQTGTTRKYKVMKKVFLNEDDISFYLLGAFMSDGCLSISNLRIQITSIDIDWLESMRNLICPGTPITRQRKDSAAYEFRFYDIDCFNWLNMFGCTPKKSKTLSLKKKIPKKYIRDFLRGMIDGDGSISIFDYNNHGYNSKRIKAYLCSASKTIIDQIEKFIPKHISYSKYEKKPPNKTVLIRGIPIKSQCTMYNIAFYETNAQKFLKWIYYSEHKISLSRKNNLAIEADTHTYKNVKLTKPDVMNIRKLYDTGLYTQKDLSIKFDIDQSCISRIVNGKRYKIS